MPAELRVGAPGEREGEGHPSIDNELMPSYSIRSIINYN